MFRTYADKYQIQAVNYAVNQIYISEQDLQIQNTRYCTVICSRYKGGKRKTCTLSPCRGLGRTPPPSLLKRLLLLYELLLLYQLLRLLFLYLILWLLSAFLSNLIPLQIFTCKKISL